MQLSFPAAFCPPQTAPQGVSAPPKPALGERGARLRRAALRARLMSVSFPPAGRSKKSAAGAAGCAQGTYKRVKRLNQHTKTQRWTDSASVVDREPVATGAMRRIRV